MKITGTITLKEYPAYLWGIETDERIKDLECDYQGIQPTYEELKRTTAAAVGGTRVKYPAYLWGIETLIQKLSICEGTIMYPAYLWGIETLYYTLIFKKINRIQPTLWSDSDIVTI